MSEDKPKTQAEQLVELELIRAKIELAGTISALIRDSLVESYRVIADVRRENIKADVGLIESMGGKITPDQAVAMVRPNLPSPKAGGGVVHAMTTVSSRTSTEDGEVRVYKDSKTEYYTPQGVPVDEKSNGEGKSARA